MLEVNGIDEVRALAGKELGVGDWFLIDQERINRFADATDDHQWIHVDVERAKAGPFGTTIAHGYLTLSLVVPLMARLWQVNGVRMGINYGANKVRFTSPVPAGSRIRARAACISVEDISGGVKVTNQVTVELEGSDKPACVAETITLFYF